MRTRLCIKPVSFNSLIPASTIAYPVSFNNNDSQNNGVSLVNNTKITFANTGIYNLQFSAQIIKTQGGTAEDVYIWFRTNGQDVPNSNTKLTLANNNQFIIKFIFGFFAFKIVSS